MTVAGSTAPVVRPLPAGAGSSVRWRPLIASTVNPELAEAEGLQPERARLAFMLLMALVIAIAMKIVGILLITSLLIIPAAAARRFARTPEGMAALASVLGVVAVVAGLLVAQGRRAYLERCGSHRR